MAQNNKSYRELMELQGAGTGKAATSNQMLDLILNRKPAQYNAATDPAAQAARKAAARNARAVTQDTMGQYAGMTGGVPSTAAVSAAAQAGNQAMAQGADKVAELEQMYLDRYNRETQGMYTALGALQQAEGDAFSRQMQEQQWAYQKEQDAFNRQMQEQQWAFQQQQAAKADEEAEYQKKLAMAQLQASYGDLSGLKALGVDTSKYAAGGGSGGGGGYYTPKNPVNPKVSDKNPESGIPAEVKNDLKYQYGSNLPEDVYEQVKAQYGEDALIAAGFTKKVEQKKPSSGGAGAGTGHKKPGAGNNWENLMN